MVSYPSIQTRKAQKARLVRLATATAFALMAGAMAHASNTSLPWETGLTTLMTSITGPVAGILSVLAICVCGGLLAMGAELNDIVKKIMQVVLAIGICVGAATVMTSFTNSKGNTATALISNSVAE
jgi:type IV secretion system protein VirB2